MNNYLRELIQEVPRLEHVLEQYRLVETPLHITPNLSISWTDRPELATIYAYVGNEVQDIQDILREGSERFGQRSMQIKFGVQVSLDAIRESSSWYARILDEEERRDPIMPPENDIMLTPRYFALTPGKRSYVLAHEVWHLIEKQEGLRGDNVTIREGTATYAGCRLLETPCTTQIAECNSFEEVWYKGMAGTVAAIVDQESNPFKALLTPEIRTRIARTVSRDMDAILDRLVENEPGAAITPELVAAFPEFAPLLNVQHPQQIITFYEGIGCHRLAEELARQDLTKMVSAYQKGTK